MLKINPLKGISRSRHLRAGDVGLAVALSLILTAFITYFDITIYGTYVFPIFGCTNPVNANQQFCQVINNTPPLVIPGLGTIPQSGYTLYWQIMGIVMAVPALALSISFAIVSKNIAVFFLYFATIMAPLVFGLEDLQYYLFNSQALPTSWPWLDGMGAGWNLFLSQLITPGVQHVTTLGIYAALATMVGGLALVWKIAFKLDKSK